MGPIEIFIFSGIAIVFAAIGLKLRKGHDKETRRRMEYLRAIHDFYYNHFVSPQEMSFLGNMSKYKYIGESTEQRLEMKQRLLEVFMSFNFAGGNLEVAAFLKKNDSFLRGMIQSQALMASEYFTMDKTSKLLTETENELLDFLTKAEVVIEKKKLGRKTVRLQGIN